MSYHKVWREQKEQQTEQIRDWRGTPIVVGSVVVYPGRYGSTMWMSEAEVIEILERDTWPNGKHTAVKVRRIRDNYGDAESTSYLTALSRVTVVK